MGKIGTVLLAVGIIFFIITYLYSIMQDNYFTKNKQFFSDARDLVYSVGKILTDDISCKANFKPSRLNNGDLSDLVQGLNDSNIEDMPLVTVNTDFKSLNIVKMSLSTAISPTLGAPITHTSNDPKAQAVIRKFTIYFKAKGLKTKDNNPCDSSDTSGCYTTYCPLEYQIENNENPDVIVCGCANLYRSRRKY